MLNSITKTALVDSASNKRCNSTETSDINSVSSAKHSKHSVPTTSISVSVKASVMRRVILDHDGGVDDLMALALLCSDPTLEVRTLTNLKAWCLILNHIYKLSLF